MDGNECLPLTWFIKKQNSPRESHSTGGRPIKPGTPSSRSPYSRKGHPPDPPGIWKTPSRPWLRVSGLGQGAENWQMAVTLCELSV